MKRTVALLLGATLWALVHGQVLHAETTFQAAGFTFHTQDAFSPDRTDELVLAFRNALHSCIEYEWMQKSIATVDFSFGEGSPAALADDLETFIRQLDSMKFLPRKPLDKSRIARFYRFVVHPKPSPTWDDGKPVEGVTDKHTGIVYVTLDAKGEVNGVFYAASWSESTFPDPKDKVQPNLSEAICS